MATDDWLQNVSSLVYRTQELGVTPDLASLSLCDLWGLYCYLRRIVEG